jgi:hypothetical protein
MLVDTINLVQGSTVTNLVVEHGTSFPAAPQLAQVFFMSTGATPGLHYYDGTTWCRATSVDELTATLNAIPKTKEKTCVMPGRVAVAVGTSRYYFTEATTITKCAIWAGVPPSGTTLKISIKLNGGVVYLGELPIGTNLTTSSPLNISVAANSYVTVDVTDAANTEDVGVKIIYN